MANDLQGEVEIKIGGELRTLRLALPQQRGLERELRKLGYGSLIGEVQRGVEGFTSDLLVLVLKHSLAHEKPAPTEQVIEEWVADDVERYTELAVAAIEVILVAIKGPEYVRKAKAEAAKKLALLNAKEAPAEAPADPTSTTQGSAGQT